MTNIIINADPVVWVAIDVAKKQNDVLVELPNGRKKKFKLANQADAYKEFIAYLTSLSYRCEIGLEATANYHRPIAYHLQIAGFKVHLISALAAARTREALHNSWDKNDPKDAQVILHLFVEVKT